MKALKLIPHSVDGIYVILDNKTGKLYIGKANVVDGVWKGT